MDLIFIHLFQVLSLVLFFYWLHAMRRIYLTTADGRPKPQQCFLSGRLRWTLLPKESYSGSLSDHGSTTQLPSNWEADTLWLPIRFSTCKKQELNLHSKSVCLRHTNTQAFRCESEKNVFSNCQRRRGRTKPGIFRKTFLLLTSKSFICGRCILLTAHLALGELFLPLVCLFFREFSCFWKPSSRLQILLQQWFSYSLFG